MKKRKVYEISVIDKTYSKIISDETKFYTSDTALELGFELKETEYNFESAEIVLLNIDDRSLVTRPVTKVLNSFTYELEDDIIAHYGEWRGQLRFEQAGETYVSSPVKFRIENDLSNDIPPQLSDVQSWVSLKRYADKLTEELKQAVLSVEGIEDTFNANETIRQSQFETGELSRQTTFEANESERDRTFESNESTRQAQELEREEAEATRQTVFEDNESSRTETFNTNEATRQENETVRQQAESQRQSTFETNETERQTTFETAEQGRQSAEIIRVENENKRNLTSVDEFIKLQNAIGGRNLTHGNTDVIKKDTSRDNRVVPLVYFGVMSFKANTDYTISLDLKVNPGVEVFNYNYLWGITPDTLGNTNIGNIDVIDDGEWHRYSKTFNFPIDRYGELRLGLDSRQSNVASNIPLEFTKWKLEEGSFATPYTKAPESYTAVSKDDYYNHIELVNNAKDDQFNQLKKAVIALGGTI